MLGSAPPPPSPPLGLVHWERPGAIAALAPVLVAPEGGGFVLAWESRADGDLGIRVARREPGAKGTWAAPWRLDDPPTPETPAVCLEPRLAAAPAGRVVALWQDGRSGVARIRGRVSRDAGRTWDDPSPSVSDGPGPSTMPSLVADSSGPVLAAWEDGRDGDRDVRVSRSADGGFTWEPSRRADSDAAGSANSFHPQWHAPGNGVALILWWDDRDGLSDLYVRRSTDDGATWAGPELRLDEGPPGATVSHEARWDPDVTGAKARRLRVSWEESDPLGGPQRWSRESTDSGATWQPAVRVTDGHPEADTVRAVSASGDTLLVQVRPGADGSELRATLRTR
jgi:hypothetical protein